MHDAWAEPNILASKADKREIKRAVADIFFGGRDELQEATMRMPANEEIVIVKLYDWLMPP